MLSTRAGVDPLKVFEAIKGGLAGSTVMNAKVPMITDGNFRPGFKIDLTSRTWAMPWKPATVWAPQLPLTSQVMEMMQNPHADGLGESDHSAIARYYEKLTGTEIRV